MWEKLKREWKTFVWVVIGLALESWDQVIAAQLGLVDPLIAPEHQWLLHWAIPVGMLALRKWRDSHEDK